MGFFFLPSCFNVKISASPDQAASTTHSGLLASLSLPVFSLLPLQPPYRTRGKDAECLNGICRVAAMANEAPRSWFADVTNAG